MWAAAAVPGTRAAAAAVPVMGELPEGALPTLIANSWWTNPKVMNFVPTRLPGSPDHDHRPRRHGCQETPAATGDSRVPRGRLDHDRPNRAPAAGGRRSARAAGAEARTGAQARRTSARATRLREVPLLVAQPDRRH